MTEAAPTEEKTQEIVEETANPEVTPEVIPSESATEDSSEPKEDGFQKRINKVTADKYAEMRRADELQRQLDDMSKPQQAANAPTLAEHDFDEPAYNAANIKHQVAEALKAHVETQKQNDRQAADNQKMKTFNNRVAEFNKDDFVEKANAVPILPVGVADALTEASNGPELIYHLGAHLNIADDIAKMTPTQAIMELGRLSHTLENKPDVKPSAAPEPISPLNSGGAISKDRGPSGATFE